MAADPATMLGWVSSFLASMGLTAIFQGAIAAGIVIGLTSYALSKFGGKGGDH